MGAESKQLSTEAVNSIVDRLSASPDLRLPGQMTRPGAEAPSVEKRKAYLEALLLRDPGVFLERHGEMLSAQERAAFNPLRDIDYEVDFYLKLLEDKEDSHKQDTAAKNRRLAYMNRLLQEGTYFSHDAMKERQPWLHHQYVGQYTPPGEQAGPAIPPPAAPAAERQGEGGGASEAPGVPLSQSLLRHQEELEAMLARRAEQERYDRMEEESESESEEEENEEGAAGGGGAAAATDAAGGRGRVGGHGRGPRGGGGEEEEGEEEGYVVISQEERQENAAAFLDLMKEKFLRGEDAEVDYKAIDADAGLDDDWVEQVGRDAEEKYFDEE